MRDDIKVALAEMNAEVDALCVRIKDDKKDVPETNQSGFVDAPASAEPTDEFAVTSLDPIPPIETNLKTAFDPEVAQTANIGPKPQRLPLPDPPPIDPGQVIAPPYRPLYPEPPPTLQRPAPGFTTVSASIQPTHSHGRLVLIAAIVSLAVAAGIAELAWHLGYLSQPSAPFRAATPSPVSMPLLAAPSNSGRKVK